MGRNIVNQSVTITEEGAETTKETPDNYVTQIVKLIPAEIVGVYLGIQNLLFKLDDPSKSYIQIVIFILILAIIPKYLERVGGITDPNQRMISLISYIIWAISLGGPFAYFLDRIESTIPAQTIGGILIMLYTIIVPMLYKAATPKP